MSGSLAMFDATRLVSSIVIIEPRWGRDWSGALRDCARSRNVILDQGALQEPVGADTAALAAFNLQIVKDHPKESFRRDQCSLTDRALQTIPRVP
jgi:hypothetical protein